ncbi:hypothetical protein RUA4292_02511 [Ruegeria atlantica]|uniref:Uncharacterized protein n=1 Tax=Ruegeria atlantica TaxID=81569 RepID=A0A0P1EEG4_9RHOB|nr:hypothetical protein RUA4292_02511 [Ruegeria atlantica]
MTIAVWIYSGAALIIIVGAVLAIRSSFSRDSAKSTHGVKPGHGDAVVSGGETAGRGHSTPVRVSMDPQEYAKALAPKK